MRKDHENLDKFIDFGDSWNKQVEAIYEIKNSFRKEHLFFNQNLF